VDCLPPPDPVSKETLLLAFRRRNLNMVLNMTNRKLGKGTRIEHTRDSDSDSQEPSDSETESEFDSDAVPETEVEDDESASTPAPESPESVHIASTLPATQELAPAPARDPGELPESSPLPEFPASLPESPELEAASHSTPPASPASPVSSASPASPPVYRNPNGSFVQNVTPEANGDATESQEEVKIDCQQTKSETNPTVIDISSDDEAPSDSRSRPVDDALESQTTTKKQKKAAAKLEEKNSEKTSPDISRSQLVREPAPASAAEAPPSVKASKKEKKVAKRVRENDESKNKKERSLGKQKIGKEDVSVLPKKKPKTGEGQQLQGPNALKKQKKQPVAEAGLVSYVENFDSVMKLVSDDHYDMASVLPICLDASIFCVVECSNTRNGETGSTPEALLIARAPVGRRENGIAISTQQSTKKDAAKLASCRVAPKEFYGLLGSGRYVLETAEILETTSHKICYRNGQLLIAGPVRFVPKHANEAEGGSSSSALPESIRPGPTSMSMNALCDKLLSDKSFRIVSVACEEETGEDLRFASLGGVRVTIGKRH